MNWITAAARAGLRLTLAAIVTLPAHAELGAGLRGFWRFEQNGADDSGGGRDLTLFGDAGFAAGLNGQALDLPGDAQQYAAREQDDEPFDFGGAEFTVSAWVRYYSADNEQVVAEKFEGQSGPGWTLTKMATNQLRFHAHELVTLDTPALAISTGDWNHFVVRRRGDTVAIFWNGTLQVSNSVSGSISDTDLPLRTGKRNERDGRDFPLNGRIDELAIWTRGLADDEVAQVYNNGQGGTLPVIHRGDMNCDGAIDFNDIDPFVLALTSEDDYHAAYPECNFANGDVDCDGGVNFNDIDGFVNCIINGACDNCP